MMLNCGAMAVPCRPRRWLLCVSSINTTTERLRSQLDQLHAEAETTRIKANNARLRLLRLSEAAENLRRQATLSLQKGKENDARELLFQKKKIMQALEKSKSRIELLDDLSTKLNEAISIKESQLIGNIAVELEVSRKDISSSVHIVSPRLEEDVGLQSDLSKHHEGPDARTSLEGQALNMGVNEELEDPEESLGAASNHGDDFSSKISGISHKDFLEWLDHQLEKIEGELATILQSSSSRMENRDSSDNIEAEQIFELSESVRSIRKRISGIMQLKMEAR